MKQQVQREIYTIVAIVLLASYHVCTVRNYLSNQQIISYLSLLAAAFYTYLLCILPYVSIAAIRMALPSAGVRFYVTRKCESEPACARWPGRRKYSRTHAHSLGEYEREYVKP